MSKDTEIQGEGNYDAAKEFDDAEKKFVESGKVDQAARDAEPKNEKEKEEMERAEEEGKRRAKGEDPAVKGSPDGKAGEP